MWDKDSFAPEDCPKSFGEAGFNIHTGKKTFLPDDINNFKIMGVPKTLLNVVPAVMPYESIVNKNRICLSIVDKAFSENYEIYVFWLAFFSGRTNVTVDMVA